MTGEQRLATWAILKSSRSRTIVVLLLLAVQSGLIAYSATRHSPTHLEPALLAAGVSHWETGRFELYRVNPPLVRMIAALPVIAAGCKTDWHRYRDAPGSRSEFDVGEDFVNANGPASIRLFIYARWVCIPFALIGSYFAYLWSKELYGPNAGLLTLWLWVFEPNLLAHSELITSDSACTAFGVACGYWFYRWLKNPGWKHAGMAGLFLGLAQLSKLSWLFLFGLWPVLWLYWCYTSSLRPSTSPSRPSAVQMGLILVLALYVINLGYAFDGTGTRLKEFQFVSTTMTGEAIAGRPGNRFRGTVLGEIPVPFPKQFLLGFDSQKKDFEAYRPISYLHGTWQHGGWWYYYIYGLLVKVPLGTLGLLAWCGFRHWNPHGDRFRTLAHRDYLILAPAACLFLMVSAQTEFNHHLRYVFPALGLMLVWAGQLAAMTQTPDQQNHNATHSAFFYLTHRYANYTLGALILSVCSTIRVLSVFPHHLAYFNEAAGGGRRGSDHISHSSLDWGQDSLLLHYWFVGYAVQHPDCNLVICPAPWWDHSATLHSIWGPLMQDVSTRIRYNARGNPLKNTWNESTVFAVSVNRFLIQPDSLAERFPVESCERIGTIGFTTVLYRVRSSLQSDRPIYTQNGVDR